MRLIVGASPRAHSEPIFKRLQIRQLLNEIQFRRALLAYKVVKKVEDHDIVLLNEFSHSHETRFVQQNLPLPRKKTFRYGTNSLEYNLIKSYNSLPHRIQNLQPRNATACKKIIGMVFPC